MSFYRILQLGPNKSTSWVALKLLDETNFMEEFSKLCEDYFDESYTLREAQSKLSLKEDFPVVYKQALQSFVDECFETIRQYI